VDRCGGGGGRGAGRQADGGGRRAAVETHHVGGPGTLVSPHHLRFGSPRIGACGWHKTRSANFGGPCGAVRRRRPKLPPVCLPASLPGRSDDGRDRGTASSQPDRPAASDRMTFCLCLSAILGADEAAQRGGGGDGGAGSPGRRRSNKCGRPALKFPTRRPSGLLRVGPRPARRLRRTDREKTDT